MIVTIPEPKKCPTNGINPQTKTIIPMAMGEGRPRTSESAKTKTEAIAAITIWLPTNEPTRAMIAFVR